MRCYFVGMKYVGPEREIRVCVKGCRGEAEGEGLDRIRSIDANDADDAARKYVELVTGGTAAVRRPN